MLPKTTPDPDTELHQHYEDDTHLLALILEERDQLLRELKDVALAPLGTGTLERFMRFDLIRAQGLLFELSIRVQRIDSLIVQINSYAEQGGMPLVGLA